MNAKVAPGDLLSRIPARASARGAMIAELSAGAPVIELALRDRIRSAKWSVPPLSDLTPTLLSLWESGSDSLTFYVAAELAKPRIHYVKRLDDAMNAIDKFHREDKHAVPLIRKLLAHESAEKERGFARLLEGLPESFPPQIESMMRALAFLPDRFIDIHGDLDRELFEPRLDEPREERRQDLRIALVNLTHECNHTSHRPYLADLEQAYRPLTLLEPDFIERTRPKLMNP